MKKDLSIVIVTYNSEDTIMGCVNSIYETVKEHSFEIIISDNGMNARTEIKIKEELSGKVIYTHNAENYGFSKGNNIGIKKAHGKYVLFLNPDTVVHANTIDFMIEFMEKNEGAGAATCKVLLPNGEPDDSSHRGFPTPWNALSHFSGLSKLLPKTRIFGGYNMSYLTLDSIHEIDSLAGSFMIVPFKLGEMLGWWDEDYFFYGEDIDFCYRLKAKGYKIYFVPNVTALHLKGISSGIKKVSKNFTKASNDTKKFATYHRFKAMEIFYNKHYKKKYSPFVTSLVMLGIKAKRLLP